MNVPFIYLQRIKICTVHIFFFQNSPTVSLNLSLIRKKLALSFCMLNSDDILAEVYISFSSFTLGRDGRDFHVTKMVNLSLDMNDS